MILPFSSGWSLLSCRSSVKDVWACVSRPPFCMHLAKLWAFSSGREGIIWEGVSALTGQEHSQVYSVIREQSSLFLTGFTSLRCRLKSYVVFVLDVLEELGAGLEILVAHCTFVLHLRVSQLCPNANNIGESLSYRGSLGRLISRLLGPLQLGLVQLGLAHFLLGRWIVVEGHLCHL